MSRHCGGFPKPLGALALAGEIPSEQTLPADRFAWVRHRFYANPDDYRPVKWPAIGPYWCSGMLGDGSHSIVVAYLPRDAALTDWWPEACEVESEERVTIEFSSRFPCPAWWSPEGALT